MSTSKKEPSLSAFDEELAKHKHELEGFLNTEKEVEEPKKKKSRRGRTIVLNENHRKIRTAVEASGKWEEDLESVHGLHEMEASLLRGLVGKYLPQDTFPESEPRMPQKYMSLAREGWKHMKEVKRVVEKYPQENCDQFYRNGVWHWRSGPTLKELEEERKAEVQSKKCKASLRVSKK